jgi:hypothetical protein
MVPAQLTDLGAILSAPEILRANLDKIWEVTYQLKNILEELPHHGSSIGQVITKLKDPQDWVNTVQRVSRTIEALTQVMQQHGWLTAADVSELPKMQVKNVNVAESGNPGIDRSSPGQW